MNDYDQVVIGFGNSRGQTVKVLQQKANIIKLGDIGKKTMKQLIIKPKEYSSLGLGRLQSIVRKNRDHNTLQQMLKVDVDSNFDEITSACQNFQNKIANDLAVLGAMMEETTTDQFIQKTKASAQQANKYLNKYNDLEKAVAQYKRHQQVIQKFMKDNQCDRENAVQFLQSCNYNPSFLQ